MSDGVEAPVRERPAWVRIVSKSHYPETGRHNVRLASEDGPVDCERWRKALAPDDVVVSSIEWQQGGTWFLYLTWVDRLKEETVEYWDRP